MVFVIVYYLINDVFVDFNIGCDGWGFVNFSSDYLGGVNFLFVDGGVCFFLEWIEFCLNGNGVF